MLASHKFPIPGPADITPRSLAVALTFLEGERYNLLFPADYIVHLLPSSTSSNIVAACTTNYKIVLWVQQSILHPAGFGHRAEVFKFFVNTAMVSSRLTKTWKVTN